MYITFTSSFVFLAEQNITNPLKNMRKVAGSVYLSAFDTKISTIELGWPENMGLSENTGS